MSYKFCFIEGIFFEKGVSKLGEVNMNYTINEERIATLVNKVSISLVARNQSKEIIGVCIPFYEKIGMTQPNDVMVYNHIEWTDFKVGGTE